MEGKDWGKRGEQDKRNRELIKMPEGKRVTYDELEALATRRLRSKSTKRPSSARKRQSRRVSTTSSGASSRPTPMLS